MQSEQWKSSERSQKTARGIVTLRAKQPHHAAAPRFRILGTNPSKGGMHFNFPRFETFWGFKEKNGKENQRLPFGRMSPLTICSTVSLNLSTFWANTSTALSVRSCAS